MEATGTMLSSAIGPFLATTSAKEDLKQAEIRMAICLKQMEDAMDALKLAQEKCQHSLRIAGARGNPEQETELKTEEAWQKAFAPALESIRNGCRELEVDLLQKRILPPGKPQPIKVLKEGDLDFVESGLSLKSIEDAEPCEFLQLCISYEKQGRFREGKDAYISLAMKLHGQGHLDQAIQALEISRKFSPALKEEDLFYIKMLWERGKKFASTPSYLNGLRDLEKASALLSGQAKNLTPEEDKAHAELKMDLMKMKVKNDILHREFENALRAIESHCLRKNGPQKQGIVCFGHVQRVEEWIEKTLFRYLELVKITLVRSSRHIADLEKLRQPLQDPNKFILFVLTPEFNRYIQDKSPNHYTSHACQLELSLFLDQVKKANPGSPKSLHTILFGQDDEYPWPVSPGKPNTYDFREPKGYFDQIFTLIKNVQDIPEDQRRLFSHIVSKFTAFLKETVQKPMSDVEASRIAKQLEEEPYEESVPFGFGLGVLAFVQTLFSSSEHV